MHTARRGYFGEHAGLKSNLQKRMKLIRQYTLHKRRWVDDPEYRNKCADMGFTNHFPCRCTESWAPADPYELASGRARLKQHQLLPTLLLSFANGGVYSTDATHPSRTRFVEALCHLSTDEGACEVGDKSDPPR